MDQRVGDTAGAPGQARRRVAYYMDASAWPGGAEVWLTHLMYGLAEAGWQVSLFLSDRRETDGWVGELESHGVAVTRFRPTREISAGGFLEARRLLRGFPLVHFNKTHPRAMLPAIPAARSAGARAVVSTEHVVLGPASRYPFGRQVVAHLVRRTNAVLDAVTVPCEYARRVYAGRYRVSPSKIVNVGTAVRLGRFEKTAERATVRDGLALRSGDFVAVIVGRLHEAKGLEAAVGAVPAIVAGEPRFRLVLVGAGPLEEALSLRVSEEGLTDRVTFAGRRDDVPDILTAADLLILPSESETAPLTVLEAMAAGLPVIATDVGGVGEAVQDGVTGLLIEPRNPRAIAEAVLSIAALPDGGAAMGRAGRQVVRDRFSAETLVSRVTRLYEGLLGGGMRA